MDTMTTEKPMKPLTIKQLLSSKWQTNPHYYLVSKETYERAGIIIFLAQMIIDVNQQASADNEPRYAKPCREQLQQAVSCKIVPKEAYDCEGMPTCAMVEDNDDQPVICLVNDMYRRTAEKIGNVVAWHYGLASAFPAIVGIDAQGNRRAMIACIVDNK